MFKYLSLIYLLSAPFAFGMAESKESGTQTTKLVDSSMIHIKSCQDVAPFARKIVAYKTASYDLSHKASYSIDSDTSLAYGFVVLHKSKDISTKKVREDYSLSRLLKLEGIPLGCPLENIGKDVLQIKCATSEEISKIVEAIKSGKADFEWGFLHEGLKEALSQ